MNDEQNLGMHIISTKDQGQSFLTLESGRAVAFMMDDALPYGERAKARDPSEWIVVGKPASREAYGCSASMIQNSRGWRRDSLSVGIALDAAATAKRPCAVRCALCAVR